MLPVIQIRGDKDLTTQLLGSRVTLDMLLNFSATRSRFH